MNKKNNRHSTRLKNWDYSSNGYYFVTLCTQDRINLFGDIKNEMMVLNEIGKIVKDVWKGLMNQTPTVLLDEYQIMPNHVYGVIKINNNIVGVSFMKPKNDIKSYNGNINQIAKSHRHMGLLNMSKHGGTEVVIRKMGVINYAPTKIITLGHIIRYFKAKTSYKIHEQGFNQKIWQRNYHDRIIRRDINIMDNINFA